MTTVTVEKLSRQDTIAHLRKRDGNKCAYPECGGRLDFDIESDDDKNFVTIDHWMPQHYGKANGWTYEEIWDLSNLRLMHKKCNAKKGDRIPDENGVLPEKVVRKFRYRRDKRATRPDLCAACDNGHNLEIGEVCASCGCDAQRFPRSAKVKVQDCDHELFWCWACSIGVIERPESLGTAMRQAMSDEKVEEFDDEEQE